MREIFFVSNSLPRKGGYKHRVDTAISILKEFGKVRYYYLKDRDDVCKVEGATKVPEPKPFEKILNLLLNEGTFKLRSSPGKEAIEFLKQEIESHQPSLIYAHNIAAIILCSALDVDVPLIYDFTDELSMKFEQISKGPVSPVTSFLSLLESWMVGNVELNLRKADMALFITSRDMDASPYDGPKMVLPNAPPEARRFRTKKKYDFFMSGNYKYPPNLQMFEEAKRMLGKHTLLVLGSGLPEGVDQPNIILKGYVENYFKEISRARAGLFPLSVAMGLQNKVIDAFSVGLPVVVSKQVFEGLGDFLPSKSRAAALLKEFSSEALEEAFSSLMSDYERASSDAEEAHLSYVEWFREKRSEFTSLLSEILD